MNPKPGSDETISILLIDDEIIFRSSLRLLLDNQQGFKVMGEAMSCAEALEITSQQRPDIVLLDLTLGEEDGIDCLIRLRSADEKIKVLVLTSSSDSALHYEAINHGAHGVIRKSESTDHLVEAIRNVSAGEAWLDGRLAARLLEERWRAHSASNDKGLEPTCSPTIPPQVLARISRLTIRERQIIRLIGEGLSNKKIAERLFISHTTVRHHLSTIFDKLEVSDRFELVVFAFRYSLAQIPH